MKRSSSKKLTSKSNSMHNDLLVRQFFQKINVELEPFEVAEDKKLFDLTVHLHYPAAKATLMKLFGDDLDKVRFPLTKKQRSMLKHLIDLQRLSDRYLIDEIFSELHDDSGIGFFTLKTPKHVKKLRNTLMNRPNTLPLDDELRKELNNIANSALNKKPYFRHFKTEFLYRNVKHDTDSSAGKVLS